MTIFCPADTDCTLRSGTHNLALQISNGFAMALQICNVLLPDCIANFHCAIALQLCNVLLTDEFAMALQICNELLPDEFLNLSP